MAGNGFNKGYIGINKLADDEGGVRNSRKGYTHKVDREWRYEPVWERNPQWLEIPDIPEGEQKFIGLLGIQDVSDEVNAIAFRFRGAYTVDWGDGSSPEDFADNTIARHVYTFSSISADTETDAGLRQVLITVTMQGAANMTTIDLIETPINWIATHIKMWLDISFRAPNCTSLSMGSTSNPFPFMERCRILELGNVTTFANLFYGCTRLRYVEMPQHPLVVTNTSSMFALCSDMRYAPYFDTSNVTSFSTMFSNCNSLLYCPKYNTSSGTTHLRMFQNCYSLKYLPDIDLSSTTNLQEFAEGCTQLIEIPDALAASIDASCLTVNQMFNACDSLRECPAMNLSGCTNFTSMFASCFNLTKVGQLQTGSGTIFTSMFVSCNSLQEIPLIDTSSGTIFTTMFSGCSSLLRVPELDLSSGTTFTSMFASCSSLRRIDYAMNTSSGTIFNSMFSTCTGLMRIPDLDLSSVTSNTGIDSNATTGRMCYLCYNLSDGTFVGATRAISLLGCKFGQAQLVDIFNALGTAAGTQVIDITQNPGAILLTEEERAIATGKGWTITG